MFNSLQPGDDEACTLQILCKNSSISSQLILDLIPLLGSTWSSSGPGKMMITNEKKKTKMYIHTHMLGEK